MLLLRAAAVFQRSRLLAGSQPVQSRRVTDYALAADLRRCSPLLIPSPSLLLTGGFVVDEEGLGYADVGEEEDWGAAQQAQEGAAEAPAGGKGGAKAGAKRKVGRTAAGYTRRTKHADHARMHICRALAALLNTGVSYQAGAACLPSRCCRRRQSRARAPACSGCSRQRRPRPNRRARWRTMPLQMSCWKAFWATWTP